MSPFKKLKEFYMSSPQHRTQVHVFCGFFLIPLVVIVSLYLYFNIFVVSQYHYDDKGRLTTAPKVETKTEVLVN